VIEVSEGILQHWQGLLDEHIDEPVINVLFSSTLSHEDALEAIERAAREVMLGRLAKMDEARPGEDPFSPGSWSLAPTPSGVVIRIDEEPDDLEGLLQGIADGLGAAGIEGRFDLYKPETTVEVSDRVDLFECRLRLKGTRYQLPNGLRRWRADAAALHAAVDAGIGWCLGNGHDLPLALKVGLAPATTLTAQDDLAAYLRQALELTADLGVTHLTSTGPKQFRMMAISVLNGRFTLAEGGATIERDGWQPTLQHLREALEPASQWAVYGFIKRGSRKEGAELGISLYLDWVTVPQNNPLSNLGDAFEDTHAPDSFGIQLLGSGYSDRIPDGPDWKHSPVRSGAVILEHLDPEAWFGRLFGPFGGYRTVPTDPDDVPDVVARARKDLAPILYTDDHRFTP
jgi:hypothetical protein